MFLTLTSLVFIMYHLDMKCTGTQECHIQKRKEMHQSFSTPHGFLRKDALAHLANAFVYLTVPLN